MFIQRWVESFRTGDSDIIGMVCCEIALAGTISGGIVVGIAFAIKTAFPGVGLVAVPVFVAGVAIVGIPVLFVLVVALVQLFKAIFGPQEHEGFDI